MNRLAVSPDARPSHRRRFVPRFASLILSGALVVACDRSAGSLIGPDDPKTTPAGQELLDSINAGLHSKLTERANDSTRVVASDVLESVKTQEPNSQQIQTQTFRVQKVRYSLAKNADKFMTVDANADVVWPGSLVQGKSIAGNAPSSIPVPEEYRKPLRVTMTILSGAGANTGANTGITRLVEQPSLGTMGSAMSGILNGFAGAAPAKTSLEISRVNSDSHLNASLGLGYSGTGVNVAGSFKVNWNDKKTRFMVSLVQQYYTMAVAAPDGPATMWDVSKWGTKDLGYFASKDNPVTYIASVTYGRVFFMLYETSASSTRLEAALNATYNGGIASASADAKAEYAKAFSSANLKMYQYGGSASDGFDATNMSNPTGVQDFLKKGATFSNASPGAPLSFLVRYLYNNDLVKLANMMDFEVEERIPEGSPTISWVQSDFSLAPRSAEAWGSVGGYKGAVKLRLLAIDDQRGETRELWRSPCNTFCGKAAESHAIPWVEWYQGTTTYPVTWSPTQAFKIDNRAGVRFAVECTIWNLENITWSNDVHSYEWDEILGKFTLRGNKDAKFCWATSADKRISGGFHIEVRINGQVQ